MFFFFVKNGRPYAPPSKTWKCNQLRRTEGGTAVSAKNVLRRVQLLQLRGEQLAAAISADELRKRSTQRRSI
jgi:hypothetical protein